MMLYRIWVEVDSVLLEYGLASWECVFPKYMKAFYLAPKIIFHNILPAPTPLCEWNNCTVDRPPIQHFWRQTFVNVYRHGSSSSLPYTRKQTGSLHAFWLKPTTWWCLIYPVNISGSRIWTMDFFGIFPWKTYVILKAYS